MRFLKPGSFISLFALLISDSAHAKSSAPFNPRAFPKKVAHCTSINRAENSTQNIAIHYVDINPGAKTTLVMVHGWPSLWSSWARQIQEFQDEYHLIAPDHRGFGASTHPGDVESSSTMPDLVGDLSCVLDDAGVHSAICVGHDWGAQVCWEAARMRPDIFTAVVGAAIPYIPSAAPFVPIRALVDTLPRLTYQLFFQDHTRAAVAELDADIRRTLRATLRDVATPPPQAFLTSAESFLFGWHDTPEIPPIRFLSADEEDYFVEQYSISGFENTLGFYTRGNRHGSWDFTHAQGNHTIPQPALSILPTADPVADWQLAAKLLHSADYIPHLTTATIAAAHWPQLEKPEEFNAILRRWLDALPKSDSHHSAHPEPAHAGGRIADEL